MKYNLTSDLSVDGLNKLARELNTYASMILPRKTQLFIEKLAERGIKVANYNIYSDFRGNITFTYNLTGTTITDVTGELVGMSIPIHRQWYDKKGNVVGEYDIDPIAMAEFGAGWFASTNPWDNIPSTRGTLGKNGNKSEWFWLDAQGVKHSSEEDYTINPTRPMYKAYLEMMRVYKEVAQEVFGQ